MKLMPKVTVEEVLDRKTVRVSPDITIGEGRVLAAPNQSTLVVFDNHSIVGIVLFNKLIKPDVDPDSKISEIMKCDFTLLEEEALKDEVLNFLPELRYHTLVVINSKSEILGFLSFDLIYIKMINSLALAKARLNAIMETVDEAICVVDDKDIVQCWNNRAELLYNIPASEILERNIGEYFSNLMVTKVIKERQGVRSVYHQPCKGTHVLISASPVKVDQQIMGAVSSERDITEVVQLNDKLTYASSQVSELKSEINRITAVQNPFAGIKGHHIKLTEIINVAKKVATTKAAVMIRGESGTGKELLARAIHDASNRSDNPFIMVNCAAIPTNIFESELFGYESSAFPGANNNGKAGFLEMAEGGTLFLDEIAELTQDMQIKLLRVLMDQVFYRLGGTNPLKINLRLITATHRNLEEMLNKGTFREDLYYILNIVSIEMPPLRERREDIPELVYQFTQEYSRIYGKNILRIDPEVMATLLAYPWPGNIREMKNTIERMVILAESDIINKDCIPSILKNKGKNQVPYNAGLVSVTEQTERELIESTLAQNNGNRSKAAKMLGIPRSTLYYKMHQLGLL